MNEPGRNPARPLTICAVGDPRSLHFVRRARLLAERGHRVFAVCSSPADTPGVSEAVPVSRLFGARPVVRVCDGVSRLVRGRPIQNWAALRFLSGVRRTLLALRPDVVHVHYAFSPEAWAVAAAGVHPLVVSVMGGDVLFEEQGRPTPLGKRLTLELLARADLITAKSEHLVAALDRLGDFRRKTMLLAWGVRLSEFHRRDASALRARLGLADAERVILSPRILQPLYNIHLLIEALPMILVRFPRARLLLTEPAADAAYKRLLQTTAEKLSVTDRVLFAGAAPHEEMPLYYSLADAVVAAPSSDGMPQSLFEALACEAPVVLARLPCYDEFVRHEESALLVERTPRALADAVVRLWSDDELRARLTRRGRGLVAGKADLDRNLDGLEARYRTLPGFSAAGGVPDRWRMKMTILRAIGGA